MNRRCHQHSSPFANARRLALALLASSAALLAPSARCAQPSAPAPGAAPPPPGFRFAPVNDTSLGLWEADRPVLVYNHGVIRREGVPENRQRSTYVHPLYGLDGEVLTDDFPKDHYHHRGLFWAWPHVNIEGQHYDLWMLTGIRHQFERWSARTVGPDHALLGVENGWYVGERKVLAEQAWLRIHPATPNHRAIDVELSYLPLDRAVTLAGAEGKSYGGLTLRFAPRTGTVITTPLGNQANDLPMTRLPWADLTAQFAGPSQPSGAAIFIAPDHPDYPPMWLTRHYGVLCVGWPGTTPQTLPPGQPIRTRYRVWIHRGAAHAASLEQAYESYRTALPALAPLDRTPPQPPAGAPATSTAQQLRAEAQPDRLSIFSGDTLFTEYLFSAQAKYPYFYPVNGPHSGQSVTVHKTDPYPHHSSLFFGCDRVNGGNYWQEGLERGRIASQAVRLTEANGNRIRFEQDCSWDRPGAESPFRDYRHVTIFAPAPNLRCIDFDITLTAQVKVRIQKNNHSLFSARMAPDLAVTGGGTLVNAQGDSAEKGTFGRPAPWAHYAGQRNGQTEGLAILCHPTNPWFPPPWFTRDYGFFSPTPMFWLDNDRLDLDPGQTLRFRYRVLVHSGQLSRDAIAALYQQWTN
ncbi:MAG: hypothetical protein FJ387_17855 [Verrucomicrobia bacterium]|nr:hypothetical protein [Verrucomicrobiota bacterium]